MTYNYYIIIQANDSRKELYNKEKELLDLTNEVRGLKVALKDANDQCILLFNEVQKAWKVSFTLQADLKVLILDLFDLNSLQLFASRFDSIFCFMTMPNFLEPNLVEKENHIDYVNSVSLLKENTNDMPFQN